MFKLKILFKQHFRLFIAMAVGIISWLLLNLTALPRVTVAVLAFDIGVATYLVLVMRMMATAPDHALHHLAQSEDEGGRLILWLATLASCVSLTAITKLLSISQKLSGLDETLYVILTAVTIVLAWLFTHIIFALHYARLYYRGVIRKQPPALLFPEDNAQPDYWDFVYFACVIGTSGQTADVSFASHHARRLGTLHCVLAFFYNAAVLSLMINTLSGLL